MIRSDLNVQELGLIPGTPVGTSLIDAHAGGVGVMESLPAFDSDAKALDTEAICRRMVLVCGTSTCHMAVSRNKLFIPGVWGPYWSGMSWIAHDLCLPDFKQVLSF